MLVGTDPEANLLENRFHGFPALKHNAIVRILKLIPAIGSEENNSVNDW